MVNQLFIFLPAIVPVLVLLAADGGRRRRNHRERRKAPVTDKLLRAPGQHLREQIEKIDDEIIFTVSVSTFGPALLAAIGFASSSWYRMVIVVAACAFAAGCSWRLWNLLGDRRSYRLGLSGECAVAEELNRLRADGCHIFHDLPDAKIGNIDHVIVGPTGIYAVETKACPKAASRSEQPDHIVTYDGQQLQFPRFTESRWLAQARRNAEWLQGFLSRAVGEKVEVQAILALPGWFVKSTVPAELKVVNSKQIPAMVSSQPSIISPRLVQQVAHQLDQKCRTVDF